MSDLQAIGMMMIIGLGNMAVYLAISRWINQRADAIVSGIIRGVPVSKEHRRFILQDAWIPGFAGMVGFEMLQAAGFVAIGRTTDAEEVKLFAYLCGALLFGSAVLGGLVQGTVAYHRLRGMLPQQD